MNHYLDLLESVLTGIIYEDRPMDYWSGGVYDPKKREGGKDWPAHAHTMIGLKRLRQLRAACEIAIAEEIPGDFVECGVWRGGACIMMAAVMREYACWVDRTVWACDSFEGLPKPECEQDKGDLHYTYWQLAVMEERVRRNFQKYNLLSEQVKFLKGWFKDTLPAAPIEKIAVLRVDGDMYGSTLDCLNNLYAKVSSRGFVIIDDYNLPGCRQAVTDFAPWVQLTDIDGMGAFWRKE